MKNREVINWLTRIRDRLMTTNSKQYEAITIAIATMEKQEQEEIIDPDKNKVEALANDIGIHKLYALVKEIRGE